MKALLLQHVTIIDGTGAVPQPGMDVLVSDGRIRAIKPTGTLTFDPQQTQVYPLAGMTLLPGLIDCHVHLFADGGSAGRIDRNELPGLALLRAALHACRTLEAGITTVRDVGGQAHMEFALRQAIAAGYCTGPRLLLAGKLLSMTSAGAEAFAGMYREADGAGADVIKVMATGAVMTPGEEPGASQFTFEELSAAAEEAHKAGRKMAAHAHGSVGILNAVRAGADTIEHGTLLHESPEALHLMAEQQDRLALLAAGMEPPDVLAAIGTALQVETLPLQVQSVVLALDGDESGQKANQKLDSEVQAAGLAATLCPVPADGLGKDWSERWRRASDLDDVYLTFEAWSSAGNHVRLTV